MKFDNILKILGVLLMVYSLTLLPPILVDYIYDNGEYPSFIVTFVIINLFGLIFWIPNRKAQKELRKRDGFLIVVLFWTTLSLLSALPFILASNPYLSGINAFFEAVSGLTTTGSSVISNLDELPESILYYRNQLQLLGGMGIIILAVAILPMLGIGGLQLYKAEMTGISKDNKLAPRITQTAKTLWGIYVFLILLCILCYLLAGMNAFDAICVAFGTVSTGGYAPHDASIGYYNSRTIEMICSFFMILGGINFSLHFLALRDKTLMNYIKDPESRGFLIYIIICIVITIIALFIYKLNSYTISDIQSNFFEIFYDSIFHVISIATTTGFVTNNGFAGWPSFIPFFILYLGIIGACAGSTSGGLKFIRLLLLHKQGAHEIKQLIHPQGRFYIKYGENILDTTISNGVWGFMASYLAIFVILTLFLVADGNDFVTAFSAIACSMGNIGQTLGAYIPSFADADFSTKLILSLAMLLGRLEIFTVLVLFSPYFWNDT